MRLCLLFLSLLPSSLGLQCILYHDYIVDRTKQITMVKSTCTAGSDKNCIHVRYGDRDGSKKQGYSMGCEQTDCPPRGVVPLGWRSEKGGHICKRNNDYGTQGRVCCCSTDFCNGSTTLAGGILFAALALLLWSTIA